MFDPLSCRFSMRESDDGFCFSSKNIEPETFQDIQQNLVILLISNIKLIFPGI